MNLHYIKNYDYLVKSLVFGTEAFNPSLYFNSAGHAAIGYNFDLHDPTTFKRILTYLQFDADGTFLSGEALVAEHYYISLLHSAITHANGNDIASLHVVVQNILSIRRQDNRYDKVIDFTRVAEFCINSAKDAVGLSFELIRMYEKRLDNWITAFDFDILKNNSHLLSHSTKERAALISLVIQNVIGLDENGNPKAYELASALIDDHRPNAWFFIRYNTATQSSNDEQAIMRRLYDSELFGIYDEGVTKQTISRSYCKKLYDMYNLQKDNIMDFERDHSYLISKANLAYQLRAPDQIKNLEQSFSIAYNHIRSNPQAHFAKETAISYMENNMADLINFWAAHEEKELDHEIAIHS